MRAFTAKFEGHCLDCDGRINVGDQVQYDEDAVVHVDCDPIPDIDAPRRTERQCPQCWLVHAGECA